MRGRGWGLAGGGKRQGEGRVGVKESGLCSGSEAGSYLRLIDSCITQLKAPGPSRTCNEIREEGVRVQGEGCTVFGSLRERGGRAVCQRWGGA